jgi:uncharacterized protein YraI
MKTKLFVSTAIGAMMALSSAALAQTTATATTDLNVRAGPGPQHPVVGVIGLDEQATVNGCLEGSKWCQVSTAGGAEGWAYSDYLIADNSGVEVVVTERPTEMLPTVVYEEQDVDGATAGGVAGAATGAIAGAIIAGPIGAAVGGIAGAAGGGAAGDIIDPNQEVRTYIEQNPAEPVYLEGEVVVGASLPETVAVQEIPDYEYRYVYVNGQPVLVEPDSRRIVYIVR